MAKKNKETPPDLQSEKKSKPQEVGKATVDSIKEILTSNGEEIILTDEQIKNIINNEGSCDGLDNYKKEVQYDNIRIITNCLKNTDRTKMKDFIHRKKEYLEKNRTISKEKFKELFGGSGKFGKAEINQRNLGLCYAYSGIELLKKTNGFDEMIQTNLKETSEGWKVRLPFCDKNGKWIKVNKNDIDKELPLNSKMAKNINSKSCFLGFKILEIAFMKKYIIDTFFRNRRISSSIGIAQANYYYNKTGDFPLTHDLISKFEGSGMIDYSMELLYGNPIIHNKGEYSLSENLMDLACKYHEKGLYKIALQSKIGEKTLNNVKIIRKNLHQLTGNKGSDIIDKNGKESVKIYNSHVYSIEKCYTDKVTGEKRIRVINPRHTGIKFDISLEDCKSIFEREVVGIDINKMFR